MITTQKGDTTFQLKMTFSSSSGRIREKDDLQNPQQ
jgi:hypothetical protein